MQRIFHWATVSAAVKGAAGYTHCINPEMNDWPDFKNRVDPQEIILEKTKPPPKKVVDQEESDLKTP